MTQNSYIFLMRVVDVDNGNANALKKTLET